MSKPQKFFTIWYGMTLLDTFQWKLFQVTEKNDRKHRGESEGTWIPGGGIEVPCTYSLYGKRFVKVVFEKN